MHYSAKTFRVKLLTRKKRSCILTVLLVLVLRKQIGQLAIPLQILQLPPAKTFLAPILKKGRCL